MIAPIPVLYFVKGKQPRAMDLDTLTPGRLWPFASPLALLQRGAHVVLAEISAAIQEHIKPPPFTLDEMRDLGWFGEEA